MRRRYVFPGANGKVAFSLKPTADVEPVGVVPDMGGRLDPCWAKYIKPESIYCLERDVVGNVQKNSPGTGSKPSGLAVLIYFAKRILCSIWYQSLTMTVNSSSYEYASLGG